MTQRKVLLLDGYNLIYRARYSGMNKGEYSAIFNFFRGLRPLVEKFSPDICYFVLEGRPVKRLNENADYKGQRTYHDKDNFRSQRKEIIRILKDYFPLIVTKHNDYECDDIINYLANNKHEKDLSTIVSSDTDFIQSINENTFLYNPVRKEFVDAVEYDYVSWKSLVGDKSDNIIGFKGIGNKKALSLINNDEKFKEFLCIEENKLKYENNFFMIKFHDIEDDKEEISFLINRESSWEDLKKEFKNFEFNSIISKEKTWEKYVKTFNYLFERNCNVSWNCSFEHSIGRIKK